MKLVGYFSEIKAAVQNPYDLWHLKNRQPNSKSAHMWVLKYFFERRTRRMSQSSQRKPLELLTKGWDKLFFVLFFSKLNPAQPVFVHWHLANPGETWKTLLGCLSRSVCFHLTLCRAMGHCYCIFVSEVRYLIFLLLTRVCNDRGKLGPGHGNDDEDDQRPNDQSQWP